MPSLVEIGPVVLEKIFRSCQIIFIISQLSPLWEGCGPSFEKTWIPLSVKFGCNWPSGSGEEDDNVKSLQTDRRTEGRTDRRRTTGE